MSTHPTREPGAVEGEREAFEAYACRDGLNVTHRVVDDGLTYVALATETAWQFWQASRRSMPDTRFAAWCADLLTRAESSGLHLDTDKRAILDEARASQSDGTSGVLTDAEVEDLYVLACRDWNDATGEFPSVGVFLAKRIFAALAAKTKSQGENHVG